MKPRPPYQTVDQADKERLFAQFDLFAGAVIQAIRPDFDELNAKVAHLQLEVEALKRAAAPPTPTPQRMRPCAGDLVTREIPTDLE